MLQPDIEFPGVYVWDNLIEDIFLQNLDYDSNSYNYTFTNTGGDQRTWPNDLDRKYKIWGNVLYRKHDNIRVTDNLPEQIYDLYSYLVTDVLQLNVELIDCQINGQTMGLDGGTHQDQAGQNPFTLMFFLNSKWNPEWGGKFQILKDKDSNSVLHDIDYVPGRVVFFNGKLWHRGLAPTQPYILRKTIAFKLDRFE